MGSRMLPVECEHGVVIDWGDFGPDENDGTVGTEPCPQCETQRSRIGRCVSCEHWRNPWSDDDYSSHVPREDWPRWGVCTLIDLPEYSETISRIAFTQDAEHYRADLHTRDDFGCVLWTPARRIVCPYCHGIGRRRDTQGDTEPCLSCREDGYFDPGDDGYRAAAAEWEQRGGIRYVDPPEEL